MSEYTVLDIIQTGQSSSRALSRFMILARRYWPTLSTLPTSDDQEMYYEPPRFDTQLQKANAQLQTPIIFIAHSMGGLVVKKVAIVPNFL
jgi:hypothetical protein